MTTKRTPPPKAATKPTKANTQPTVKPGRVSGYLNPKQSAFVDQYLIDFNATQAAERAGYSKRTANEQGARLLANVSVRSHIDERREKQSENVGLTAERTIKEAMRLAFFDVRKLVDADGNPIPINKLDDDTAAAIAGLDIQEVKLGEGGAIAVVKKYKIADKNSAIERLFKHLGLFEKDNGQKNNPIAELLAAMGKSALPVKKAIHGDD